MRAAVVGAEHDRVLHPQLIGVLRVGGDPAEIPAALPDALVASDLAPVQPGIVGAVEAALIRLVAVDERIDAMRPCRARRKSDPRRRARQAVTGQLVPGAAAVGRLVQTASRSVRGRIGVPRRPTGLPQRGIDDVRIARLEGKIDRTGIGVLVKRLCPILAAVAWNGRRRAPRSARTDDREPRRARRCGLRGSTRICAICCVSLSPIGCQLAPPSVDRNMPMPCAMSERMSASPVPT